MSELIAYVYQRGITSLHLATVLPTRENTYTAASEPHFVVTGLGFAWEASDPVWQVPYWAWRRPLDHRAARGKYLHRHKGKALRTHRMKPQRPLPKVSWAVGARPPSGPGYIVRSLFLKALPPKAAPAPEFTAPKDLIESLKKIRFNAELPLAVRQNIPLWKPLSP